jgi:hypothetical protein
MTRQQFLLGFESAADKTQAIRKKDIPFRLV